MKQIRKYILILLVSLSLVACGGTDTPTTVSDTLHIGVTNTLSGFSPIYASDVVAQWIQRMMYPSLMDQPTASNFTPNLAESFESDDNQTFTVVIRDDANWSDGTPITADDVHYTLNLIANPDIETSGSSWLSSLEGVGANGKVLDGADEIAGVTVVDEKTLTLTTKTPVDPAYFMENVGFRVLIIPKHVVETMDINNLGSSVFGTAPTVAGGPYKFVAYETGSYVQLEANETYFKGEPVIKNVYLQIMDGTGLVTALQSGDVQMSAGGGIGVIPVTDIALLESNEALFVQANPSFNGQYMHMNNEIFDNATFRLAVTYAIDRQAIVDDLLYGYGEVMGNIYTSASAYKDESLEPVGYDPDYARELLAESGFDTSREIRLSVPTGNVTRQNAANLIEQYLEAIGLNIRQESFDFATHLANMNADDYDFGMIGLAFNTDPDQYSYWGSLSTNYGNLNDAYLDELLESGTAATSFEDRKEIYDEVQAYFQEQAFTVGTYSDFQYTVQAANLTGGIKEFWAGSLYDMHLWSFSE